MVVYHEVWTILCLLWCIKIFLMFKLQLAWSFDHSCSYIQFRCHTLFFAGWYSVPPLVHYSNKNVTVITLVYRLKTILESFLSLFFFSIFLLLYYSHCDSNEMMKTMLSSIISSVFPQLSNPLKPGLLWVVFTFILFGLCVPSKKFDTITFINGYLCDRIRCQS